MTANPTNNNLPGSGRAAAQVEGAAPDPVHFEVGGIPLSLARAEVQVLIDNTGSECALCKMHSSCFACSLPGVDCCFYLIQWAKENKLESRVGHHIRRHPKFKAWLRSLLGTAPPAGSPDDPGGSVAGSFSHWLRDDKPIDKDIAEAIGHINKYATKEQP